jgi:hypothetical protein
MEGIVDDRELLNYYDDVTGWVQKTNPVAGILDMTEVTSLEATAAIVRTLARSAPPISNPEYPRFLVAGSDHVYGMLRMYQIVGGESRATLHVVRNITDAYAALGITEPRFKPL